MILFQSHFCIIDGHLLGYAIGNPSNLLVRKSISYINRATAEETNTLLIFPIFLFDNLENRASRNYLVVPSCCAILSPF